MAMLGNPISTMDFPVDYFTGDGTSTTFQLSFTPASATSILVHIGGVKQVASTTDPAYYLDGSKLVFVSPPGAYSPIEVNYLGIAGQVNIPGTQSVTQDMLSLQLANTFVYQTTANGATASFTLNAPPVSANSLVVSANGVVQYDYSVNGTNLTFGFTPPVGTFIRITSLALAQAGVPSDGSVTSVKLGANLTLTGNTSFDGFSGAGARIRGDMSNGTLSNRLAFQTSTTNSQTVVGVIPNGSSTISQLHLFGSSDLNNFSRLAIGNTGTELRFYGDSTGTGSNLPMTFYTAATERMRIDTSGNVGIGVTPSAWSGVGSAFQVGVSAAIIGNGASSSSFISNAYFDGSTYRYIGTGTASRLAMTSGTYVFTSVGSGTAGNALSFTELMRIGSDGNVGIGGSTVNASLSIMKQMTALSGTGNQYGIHIYPTGSGQCWIDGLTNSSSNSSLGLRTYNNGTYTEVINNSAGNTTTFATAGTERMRIASDGNVAIGTTNTSGARLTVRGAGTTSATASFEAATSGGATRFFIQDDGTTRFFGSSNSETMRVASDGNVQIGIIGEVGRVSVKTATAVAYNAAGYNGTGNNLRLISGGTATTGTTAGIAFGMGGSAEVYIGAVQVSSGYADTVFQTYNGSYSEKMRLSTNGYLTVPNQPAFHAVRNAGNVSSTGIYICNAVTYNDGSHYNSSTGRFTAPVAGRYQLNFFVLAQNGNSFDLSIRVNGSQYPGMDIRCNGGTGGNFTLSVSAVLKLSANDIVDPFISAYVSGPVYGLGLSGFSMYLLG